MHEFADYVKQKYGSCAVARESTGNGGQITLEEEGTPAVLGNPCRAGLMANSSIKTDKIGARAPTTLLRLRRIKSVNQVLRTKISHLAQILYAYLSYCQLRAGQKEQRLLCPDTITMGQDQTVNQMHNLLQEPDTPNLKAATQRSSTYWSSSQDLAVAHAT